MNLLKIQKMAKFAPEETSVEILNFVQIQFPNLQIKKVKINDSAVSLNSLNGLLFSNSGKEYFFKFHVEENEQDGIDEYYNSEILSKIGFRVINPIATSTITGSQFLIYPKISAPTFFEICEKLEGNPKDEKLFQGIISAENEYNQKTSDIFLKTLHSSDKSSIEPIHQLFYYRLHNSRSSPRVDLFYKNATIDINNKKIPFSEVKRMKWRINEIEIQETLEEIIESAKVFLNPQNPDLKQAIVAHGDDHNGNKFYLNSKLELFDPAFAGSHIPALLALVKSTFHDVLAHPFWFYSPQKIESDIKIDYALNNNEIIINHNLEISALRKALLDSKMTFLWQPLLKSMKTKEVLTENYQEIIRKALFCCAFLTINLCEPSRFSSKMTLLTLANTILIGSKNKLTDFIFTEL